jgi:lipid-binding SYLF domain-containing protein
MVKAGFVVAGQYGNGVVLVKGEDGTWSAPAFFRISGASVGFQIGGQASDAVLVISNERGVKALLENKFTLGVDASVAAGPVGRDAEGKTDWQMKSSVYSYSRSRGLFAGVAMDGMVINEEKDANTSYYGAGNTADSVLFKKSAQASEKGKELIQALTQYAS